MTKSKRVAKKTRENMDLELASLQPGLLVAYVGSEKAGIGFVQMIRDMWPKMKEKGFYGCAVLNKAIRIESLDDKRLGELGLMRKPKIEVVPAISKLGLVR